MEDFLAELCRQSINRVMAKKAEELKTLPLAEWLGVLQEERQQDVVPDVVSVEAFLTSFKELHSPEGLEVSDLRASSKQIAGILDHILRPPNNLQFAVAHAAVSLLDQHQRQAYVLPCGAGKSRVAATIALLLLVLKANVKAVHIVYLNKVLMKKDQDDFKDLLSLVPRGGCVDYHSDIQFTPGPGSVILIDESDEYAFNDPVAFMRFTRKAACICLTATCSEASQNGIERQVLEKMRFKIFENLTGAQSPVASLPKFERVGKLDDEQIRCYVEAEAKRNAVLLYCTPEFADYVRPLWGTAVYIDEHIEPGRLRKLDDRIEGAYQILLADSPRIALRGLDFRSLENSITFATMRAFKNERELIQAANRVGRGGDRCRRVVFNDTELVDHMASCAYKRNLLQFLNSCSPFQKLKVGAGKQRAKTSASAPGGGPASATVPHKPRGLGVKDHRQTSLDQFKMLQPTEKKQKLEEQASDKENQD